MRLTPKTKERLLTLRALVLDGRAKSRMRDALDAYVDLHELQEPIASRSAASSPFLSPYFSFNTFSRMGTGVLAFALILLAGGGGIVYAAEGSVPGSTLYPVKVSVIEPVQGALITTAEGQASWHASLASRRLDEATTLAARNKLDRETQQYLQSRFNAEVDASNEDADSLAVTGKTNAAIDARSDLEARITAHAEILAVIHDHLETTASSTDPTLLGTRALLASVRERGQEVTEARLALEDVDTDSEDGTLATAATLARAEATTQTVASRAKIDDDSAVAPVAAHLMAAKSAIKQAKLAGANESASSDDARAAERSSEVASILLQHASLLRAFAPVATTSTSTMATSTTATTTASTTASTTIKKTDPNSAAK